MTTKLWQIEFADPEAALRTSLGKLGLEQVDCYLIHWPNSFFEVEEKNRVPMHKLWPSLERLVDLGLTKSIGLSNFNLQLTSDLLTYARIKPVVNQIELHPLLAQTELVRFLKDHDIVPVAYCPIVRQGDPKTAHAHEHPYLKSLAEKYGKSVTQIMLNWALVRGTVPIPKSGTFEN